MIKDYSMIFGTFRLNDTRILKEALETVEGKILVDTGVSYNIDHVLTSLSLEYKDKFDVCTKYGVDHIKDFDFYTTNHLRFLGKDILEYALVHFYEPGWEDLVRVMKKDPRIKNIGVSNFNIEQIEEYYKIFGEYPKVLQFEFSRRYHDLDLVEFCHSKGIEMMGYGIFGGIHASKMYVREYLMEDLIGYVCANGVYPIIRTDNSDHLVDDLRTYNSCRLHRTIYNNRYSTPSSKYSLSADTTDNRALNKFRYDRPKHLIRIDEPGLLLNSLDSRTNSILQLRCDIYPIDKPQLVMYREIPRDFMMVTDYLVREKFKMKETDEIQCSDDLLFNITSGELYSFNLVAEDDSLIKSGSELATVYEFHTNYYE